MANKEIYLYNSSKNKFADFKIWLAFPGIYSFSMSSLGYLWIYKTIDELEDVSIERICSDSENTLFNREEINLLGFSFSFDTDFLTIFSMLEKYEIPLLSSERTENSPLVFSGGPVVTANPMPYSDYFDFFIIGDGEDVNLEVVKLCKDNADKPRNEVLKLLSELDGVYVPKFTKKSVNKLTKHLDECIYTPVLSEDAFFGNTFILELARGCSNRCGFCLASYLNLPLRFMPYDDVLKTIEMGLANTNKIALLGAQISAHPNFKEVCNYIYQKIQDGEKIQMSVSSLRVDAVEPDVVKTLVAAGQKNSTLAIEAGSDRLRRVINKNLSEEQIFEAVRIAKDNGLKGLKFYGMIGLPTETQEDLNEIISLAKKLKQEHKGFNISFGFSTFVPKPHTPFQWCGREAIKTLEQKSNYLKKELHKLGVTATISSPKWDYYQAVLSRGDESLNKYILEVYKAGGKLGAFKSAAKKVGIDTDYFALNNYDLVQTLPWDFIKVRPEKGFLIEENKRLLNIK
ncbi:MAG: radical SAM protein [Candidatus Gastranaerophilales bacterium]